MGLPDTFLQLVAAIGTSMTMPTLTSLVTVVQGWLLGGWHTLTGVLIAVGDSGTKHFSAYYRLFAAARWSLDTLGLALFSLVRTLLGPGPIPLTLDDTLARKRGLKVVVVEPLTGGRPMQAFYSTDIDQSDEQVLAEYSGRWSIEESIQGSKSHLGFEQPQGWSRQAVRRTAPMAMLLYSLTVLWLALEGHTLYQPRYRPWCRHKVRPSFADMLATLRLACLRAAISAPPTRSSGSSKPPAPAARHVAGGRGLSDPKLRNSNLVVAHPMGVVASHPVGHTWRRIVYPLIER